MALVEVEKGPSEDKYWKPEEKGDYVEGYLYKFEKGDYGKQIVLYKGYDEDSGEYITQTLPAHADLKRTYVNLKVGDFIVVEAVDKIQTENMNYPKWIYKVLVDDDRFVTWDDSDDDYFEE